MSDVTPSAPTGITATPIKRALAMLAKPRARIGMGVLVAAIAIIAIRGRTEDRHYAEALDQLRARNFEQAVSELRLCLEDRPDYAKAKGLLAYAVVRAETEKERGASDNQSALLSRFVLYYGHLMARQTTDSVH